LNVHWVVAEVSRRTESSQSIAVAVSPAEGTKLLKQIPVIVVVTDPV
jgi:hypothetical protein